MAETSGPVVCEGRGTWWKFPPSHFAAVNLSVCFWQTSSRRWNILVSFALPDALLRILRGPLKAPASVTLTTLQPLFCQNFQCWTVSSLSYLYDLKPSIQWYAFVESAHFHIHTYSLRSFYSLLTWFRHGWYPRIKSGNERRKRLILQHLNAPVKKKQILSSTYA